MNKEQEIERITGIITMGELCRNGLCSLCNKHDTCDTFQSAEILAMDLIENGIGDKERAVKEFTEKLIENLSKRLKDNSRLKYSLSTIDHFHDKAQYTVVKTLKELGYSNE